MIGFGSYGGSAYGGGSSNLSALAPPFTVDRSIPKPSSATPLVDLGEPLNWLDTNPYTFNSPQPAQRLDPIPTSSFDQKSDLFEPKTYFPSYVSPPFHVPTFDEQSLPGLDHTAQWGVGSWGWEKGNPSQHGGSFYSKESNGSPSSIFKDHINLGTEKQVAPPSVDKLDYNPVPGQNLSFMPVGYSNTSVIGSSSALPEADLQVPSLNLVSCKNNLVPFNFPYEKPVRQHDMSGNSPSNVKEPHYLLNFGSKNEFDPSLLSYHVDGNCYLYGDSSATRTDKLSTSNMASKDASDNSFRAKPGVTFTHNGPDNFCSALDSNGVIAMENALENLDHYNPPVDSPCWRGAPSSHNSPFGSSEAVSVQLEKKLEACGDGQELKFMPMNTANMVRLPSEKPGESRMNVENGSVEDSSVSFLKLPSVSIISSRDHLPDVVGKAGSYNRVTSSACKIKFSDDASERKNSNVLFNKSADEVEKPPCTIEQNVTEGCGSSHMSCHEVKSLSCSPSSVEDISTQHSKFFGKEPVSTNSIVILLDTMHNLSKLLLHHCSNESSELKEQDCKSLEKGTSMGTPQVAAIDVWSQHVQEKTKHSGKKDEKCSDFIPFESGTDIKARNDKMTQAMKKILVENFHEKDETHPQVLLYKNLWLEAEAALCSTNYMARFNKIKIEIDESKLDKRKDLSEDASDEDKKSNSKFSAQVNTNKKLTQSAESESPTAVSNQNSSIKSSCYHADDVTARFQALKQRLNNSSSVHTRELDELSSSKLCPDLDGFDKLATEVKDNSTLGLSSQDSIVQGIACQTEDGEASVMARFQILKNRDFDNFDPNEVERKLLPEVVDLPFAGMTKQIPIDKDISEDVKSGVNLEPVSQHHVTNKAGEELVVQHDFMIQSPGNQSSSGRYDNCSSDWEHVLKEEFSGQNS
ncbi:Hexokinase type 1 [Gossypium arboreum]|uniref:Hexokinase type 1 n=1 Tax=Gossypium arboreum TaxID=29729 RepID=A0A0B0MXR5_GOSAR|nr:Hexokinase type 1 [Gossypium arboreum]